ncbi:hypothetical protein SK128_002184, partial [Halocaridina rubra]
DTESLSASELRSEIEMSTMDACNTYTSAAPASNLLSGARGLDSEIPFDGQDRGIKNWEFLMRLLLDPRTNPSLIEWENEATATFRLKQPTVIASLWASRHPGETDLSYNNFARGLRHHYKSKTLLPIPQRQLVYQCGQKAKEFLEHLRKR